MIFKQIKRNSAVSLLAMNFLDQEKLRPMLVVILYFPHLCKYNVLLPTIKAGSSVPT